MLDFSRYIPGPYASSLLAENGAEIIQVELDSSSMKKSLQTAHLEDLESVDKVLNRGKKRVSLDLRSEEGIREAIELAEKSDVIIESFRPGVMAHFGLDYESIRKINEQVVYCSLSGYGQNGEYARFGSHDLNYMALSGVLSQMKISDKVPVLPSVTIADYFGGSYASVQILAALVERSRTGQGKYLDIALLDGVHSIMGIHEHIASQQGKHDGISLLNGNVISYQIYETKDGRHVALAAIEEKFWRNFCEGIGKIDLINSHMTAANEENEAYIEMIALFKNREMTQWAEFGRKVDCCLTPILYPGEQF